MVRLGVYAFVAVLGVATPFRASGEMSMDEAGALVERVAEGPVVPGVVPRAEQFGTATAHFREDRPGLGRVLYAVNLTDGYLWTIHFPQPNEAADARVGAEGEPDLLSPAQALDIAKALAARCLGPDAGALVWQVRDTTPRVVSVWGVGPDVGDPPRANLAASCYATVLRREARVLHYDQHPTRHEPLLDPKITRGEAVGIARTATGKPDAPVDLEWTKLAQSRGVLDWYVMFDTESEPLAIIDAMTGKVKEASSAMSATSEASEDGEQAPPPSALQDSPARPDLVRMLAAPATAVVLLAALAIARRRRR